jgi:hypothetical protein
MVYNSQVAKSILSSCKNVNIPEIIHAVEQEQGLSAGLSRTTRMWVQGLRQPMSTIYPALPVEHDYNLLKSFCQAFGTLKL